MESQVSKGGRTGRVEFEEEMESSSSGERGGQGGKKEVLESPRPKVPVALRMEHSRANWGSLQRRWI